jgi:hypothetical protein
VHRDELLQIIRGYADVPYTDGAVDQAVLRLLNSFTPRTVTDTI